MTDPVGAVEAARQSLESSWSDLYEDLVTGSRDVIHGRLLYRGMAGVNDIVGAVALLLDVHRIAAALAIEEARMLPAKLRSLLAGECRPGDFQVATPAWLETTGKLAAAYKAVFFFIRAYHDTLYRMVLNVQRQPWEGKGASMASALRPDNPVGSVLRDRMPQYLPWFTDWRWIRNLTKDGAITGWAGPEADLGLVFEEVIITPGTYATRLDAGTAIRLGDVAGAIEMSGRLTKQIHDLVLGR